MNKKNIVILASVLVFMLVLGTGVAVFLINRQNTPSSETVAEATPTTTPPTLTVQSSSSSLTASQSGTLDVYLNTFGQSINGFQFIATLDGTSLPKVTDTDSVSSGVQVEAVSIPNLSVSTNSVIDQDGKQVIRFAMVTQSASEAYQTSTPVKVATVSVVPGKAGTLSLTFNTQNTRASTEGGQQDTLLSTADSSYIVSAPLQTNTIAAMDDTTEASALSPVATSSAIADASVSNATTNGELGSGPTPTIKPSPTAKPQLIGASSSTSSSTLTTTATSTSSAKATATPSATVAPQVLPVSGSTENTILLLLTGVIFIGGGVVAYATLNRVDDEENEFY